MSGTEKVTKFSPPLWWSKPPTITRYAIAVLSVALALLGSHLAIVFLHTEPFASLFFCAILFVAWFGGVGPGLFATALALSAFHYYLLPPVNSFAAAISELPRLALFGIVALFVCFLSAAQRKTTDSLRRSRDELLAAIENQRRIELSLRLNELYLAEAQRLGGTGSFGWNHHSGEIFWSEGNFRLLGYDRTISPTIELFLQRVHPGDRESVRRHIGGLSNPDSILDYECRLLMPDDSIKYIQVLSGRVGPELSSPFTTVGTAIDVTERKRADEALRKVRADLAHAARVAILGELTATIAHEVNQPLAGVVSSGNACLRWLASEPPNIENARQSADRIIRDAHRASEVIGRVRSLAKKAPPEKEWLNINDAVIETLSLTRTEAAQHGASLRNQLSDDIPPVWADRIEIQQVVLNLIINGIEAVSAAGNGQRDVLVTTSKVKQDDLLLAVCDTGTGLDPAKLEHIFDAFYTTKREGMGMGLAVSRSIIEAHGGRLWASQNEPRGAIFQFTLPIIRKEEP
jgi:C4-dicarboxylate-specific signal transduction histidine kinase